MDDEIDMVEPPPAKKPKKKKGKKQIDATAIEHAAEAIGTLLDETGDNDHSSGQAKWERKRTKKQTNNGPQRKMSKKQKRSKLLN